MANLKYCYINKGSNIFYNYMKKNIKYGIYWKLYFGVGQCFEMITLITV